MTERQELLLLLVGLYLVECFRWVRRGSGVFRRLFGARWFLPPASEFMANDQGDLHWAWPLPDFGDFLVARGLPWSAGPEGVATWHPAGRHPQGRSAQAATFLRWEEVREIELDGDKIFVADRLWWLADSQVEAQRLSSWLKRWAELPAVERESAVRADLRATMQLTAVRQRLAETDPGLVKLRRIAGVLWVILFGLMPVAIWRLGWIPALPLGLVAVYGLGGWIASTAVRCHEAWYPRATTERWRLRLLCWCSPITALRAADLAGRNRLEAYDPLVVGLALLPPAMAAGAAAAWCRDAWFPRRPENPFPVGSAAARTVAWFTAAYQTAGAEALQGVSFDAAAARGVPVASEPGHTQYCQRCQAQFLALATACRACGDRPLAPLAVAGKATGDEPAPSGAKPAGTTVRSNEKPR